MKEIKQKDIDPMQQAYKQLDATPAADGVSDAAKGENPKTDFEAQEDDHERMVSQFKGVGAEEIEEAYANLFESLAVIMRAKA